MNTLRHNPNDPLAKASPDNARELFSQFSRLANGASASDVMDAAYNLIINALRQEHATRSAAESAYDEKAARIKGVLMDHYDAGGRRRGIFPYTQHIVMPFVNGGDKF